MVEFYPVKGSEGIPSPSIGRDDPVLNPSRTLPDRMGPNSNEHIDFFGVLEALDTHGLLKNAPEKVKEELRKAACYGFGEVIKKQLNG